MEMQASAVDLAGYATANIKNDGVDGSVGANATACCYDRPCKGDTVCSWGAPRRVRTPAARLRSASSGDARSAARITTLQHHGF
jgi:hypothetical protein